TNGPLGTTDTTAPTVQSSTPADGATGVSVSADLTVTFSEAIQKSLATSDNFILIASDGTVVDCTVSADAAGEIVTINPDSNLDALSDYILIVSTNVKDLAGNALAAPYVVNFTTA
ncbi:Ig-like domain-containing protein, partial [Desulfoscipio geothermicus]